MKTAPDPKEILEFQFKQLSNLKISDGLASIPAACSLVVVDGKRGLIFAACDNKITVLRSGDNPDKNWKREYVLSAKITRLALNCDCSFFAVTLLHPIAYIYSAASFIQENLELLREIRLSSTENAYVLDLRWNPCIPGALCTITSDYIIDSFSITTDKTPPVLSILGKLEKVEVLCVAWSPKGKQLVVGCKNGNLLQLKPELKVARSITGPNPSIGSIIALLWISNYQFCAAYSDRQNSRVNVLIIDAPKGEVNATFTSYEDITYGSPSFEGEESGLRYYFEHVPEWGIIVAASSTSSEVAVLGSRDSGITWEQWQLVDSERAQLPLVRTSESYPVGLAVDRTSVNKLLLGGEGSTLPHPVPILHILGTSGVLCNFHMVNLIPGTPPICSPPTEIVPSSSQPRMSLPPTEISFTLIGGVTSTPRPKQIDTSQNGPKTTVTASLFGDTPQVPVPQPQVELNVTNQQVENTETTSKVEAVIAPSKEVNQPEKIGIDSNICISTYQEECSLFEKELKNRREILMVDIGSATERSQLIEKSEKMERFLMDLQETTASLTSDISCLKNLLLQTFAWLEETKSRCSLDSSNNPQSHGDINKAKELRNQMYYMQSQLEQAMRALDHQWLEHINKEKTKMRVPRLEFVYQNMLRHAQIITKEKNNVQTLVKKWKALTRGDITHSINKSMADMSLFSLMSPSISHTNGAIEQKCKTIASRNCSFSREKQSKLRNLLSRSTTKVIKAATPSPMHDRLKETLSSLAISSPIKQVQEQKVKSKSEPKPQQVTVPANLSVQAARSPLASLDRIIANIGLTSVQPNSNVQSRPTALNTTPVSAQIIKIPQVDSKARAAAASLTAQTRTTLGQPRQNKPISVPLFGTPQGVRPASAIPSGIKAVPISEVSAFTLNAPGNLNPPLLTPALTPTGVSASFTAKPFSKIETSSFNSDGVKTDIPPILPLPMGISPTISSPPITAVVSPRSPLQTNPETSFSFLSSVQPLASQLPGYPGTSSKTSTPAVTTASTSVKASPLQSFSFASKPANSSTFSFASQPTSSPPSSAAQSLDLSAMGLDLQAPSNTPVENLTPATTIVSNSFFGSTESPPSGSIFGGASSTAKDKLPGTIFGNSGFSSIFSGSAASDSTATAFGGGATTSSVKPQIFGGGTTSLPASTFGSSATSPVKPIGGEIPAASGFESPDNSSATSVFGNIAGNSNTASVFGGNSNASALGGAPNSPTRVFGEPTTSPIKSPIFGGNSVTSPPASGFGRPPDSKPFVFGGVPTSSATPSLFGGGSTGSSRSSIFGETAGSSQSTSTFGGTTSSPTTASVFGPVPPVSPNQSIFGGTASPTSATNIGAATPIQTANVPAFGQTSIFGAKPEFGNIFGAAKPIFGGGGFATSSFPVASQPTGGFGGFNTTPSEGNISAIGGGSMQKVFGESSGSSTFETLAAQEGGLTFGNLAQKQTEPAAPPPAFSGKSSFQSWR